MGNIPWIIPKNKLNKKQNYRLIAGSPRKKVCK